jgi:glycosyltransferase involved in cell wall biosynthesis
VGNAHQTFLRGLGSGIPAPAGPLFSVLIAARNEAANLPQLFQDLAAQTLPTAQFEVLIADDHSTDATAALVAAAAQNSSFSLRLVSLPAAQTGKKAALLGALQVARAPWVVCTDADCRVGPGWLRAYAAQLARTPAANFIGGPVLLTGPTTFLNGLVGLEFAAWWAWAAPAWPASSPPCATAPTWLTGGGIRGRGGLYR